MDERECLHPKFVLFAGSLVLHIYNCDIFLFSFLNAFLNLDEEENVALKMLEDPRLKPTHPFMNRGAGVKTLINMTIITTHDLNRRMRINARAS